MLIKEHFWKLWVASAVIFWVVFFTQHFAPPIAQWVRIVTFVAGLINPVILCTVSLLSLIGVKITLPAYVVVIGWVGIISCGLISTLETVVYIFLQKDLYVLPFAWSMMGICGAFLWYVDYWRAKALKIA